MRHPIPDGERGAPVTGSNGRDPTNTKIGKRSSALNRPFVPGARSCGCRWAEVHNTPPPAETDPTDVRALIHLLDAAIQHELWAVQEWALASGDPTTRADALLAATQRMDAARGAVSALRQELLEADPAPPRSPT